MNIVIAFILFLLITYPSSPVLFLLFGVYNVELYMLYSTIFFVLVLLKKPGEEGGNAVYKKILISYVIVYSLSLFLLKNVTAARDLITVAVILVMIIRLPQGVFINIFRKYILLSTAILFVSIITTIIFHFIGFEEWEVSKLTFISRNNPAYVRSEWADYRYFMPLYMSLITVSDSVAEIAFGITFERMPIMYDEPTSLWVVTLGSFFYALGDKSLQYRLFVLSILTAGLLLSFSVYGVLVLFCMLFYYLYMRVELFRRYNYVMLAGLLFIMLLLNLNPYFLDSILTAIGGNKYHQYLYFSEVINLKDAITFLGVSAGTETEHRSYGALSVFVRYGILGILLYAYVWYLILMRTFKICRKTIKGHKPILYFSMAILSSLLLYLKNPQMNLLLPILYLTVLEILHRTYYQSYYNAEFTPAQKISDVKL